MKYRRLLSIIMCICLIIGFVPFISVKTEAESAPTDINGNVWKYSTFVSWCDKKTSCMTESAEFSFHTENSIHTEVN